MKLTQAEIDYLKPRLESDLESKRRMCGMFTEGSAHDYYKEASELLENLLAKIEKGE